MTHDDKDPLVITGSTGMLGTAAATELARRGIDTILVAREKARGDRLVQALQGTGGSHRLVVIDLSEPDSVRVTAAAIRSDHPRVGAVVHAAAVLFQQRRTNSAGQEAMFATNVCSTAVLPPAPTTSSTSAPRRRRPHETPCPSGGCGPRPRRCSASTSPTRSAVPGELAHLRRGTRPGRPILGVLIPD